MVMVLVGASHHDVTVDDINLLAAAEDRLARHVVGKSSDIAGAVVLSTCNRFEIYLDLDRFHEAVDVTTESIASLANIDHEVVTDRMHVVVGSAVTSHLFSVASGLESMVVGEDEIAGQVRRALATAQREQTTTPSLERLMQRALATSKTVTHSTGLGTAGRSVVSVGLDIVEQKHGPVAGQRALVLGTGAYARVVIATLQRRGCTDIEVFSTSGRAGQLAAGHRIRAVSSGGLREALSRADVIVACSGAPHVIIDSELVESARPISPRLVIIDLALSPDVDKEVRDLPDVEVIDLDTIGQVAPPEHAAAILSAQDIVLRAVGEFEAAETGRTADHAVVAMRAHVMSIIGEELQRIRVRVDDETATEVARSLNRVSNAILHTPSVRAQELARTGDFADYRKAIHTLFGIEIDAHVRE